MMAITTKATRKGTPVIHATIQSDCGALCSNALRFVRRCLVFVLNVSMILFFQLGFDRDL